MAFLGPIPPIDGLTDEAICKNRKKRRYTKADIPCYVLVEFSALYQKEAFKIVERWRLLFPRKKMVFSHGEHQIRFSLLGFKEEQNLSAIIIRLNTGSDAFRNFKTKADYSGLGNNVIVVHADIESGEKCSWARSEVCIIIKKFVRYMCLNAFVDSNKVFLVGDGVAALGVAYILEQTACTFAAALMIDADISDYVLPQTLIPKIYIELSEKFTIANPKARDNITTAIARVTNILPANIGFEIRERSGNSVNPNTLVDLAGNNRYLYPQNLKWEFRHSGPRYPLFWLSRDETKLVPGDWMEATILGPNKFDLKYSDNVEPCIVLNETLFDPKKPIYITSKNQEFVINDADSFKDITYLQKSLTESGDPYKGFSYRMCFAFESENDK